jgi:hypothetical protein
MCISETAGNLLESRQHTGTETTPLTQSPTVGRRAFLGGLATIGIASSIASKTQAFDEPAATDAAPAQPAESPSKNCMHRCLRSNETTMYMHTIINPTVD